MSGEQAAGTIIGAVAGFVVGGPMGAVKGAYVGYSLGTAMTVTQLDAIEGPKVSDLAVQTSQYGAYIPRLYGTDTLSGNVFWVEGNSITEVKHVETIEQGGKAGTEQESTSYTYEATLAVGICEGEVTGVRRIWADDVLIYDMSDPNDVAAIVSSLKVSGSAEIFLGTDDQLPSDVIELEKGDGESPAFRGLCYVVFSNFQLVKFGNRIPNFRFEVTDNQLSTASDPTFFSIVASSDIGTTTLPTGVPVGSNVKPQVLPWFYDDGSLTLMYSQMTYQSGAGFSGNYDDPTNSIIGLDTSITKQPFNYYINKKLDALGTFVNPERFDTFPWDVPGGIYDHEAIEFRPIDNAPNLFLIRYESTTERKNYLALCMRLSNGQVRCYRLRPETNLTAVPSLQNIQCTYRGGMVYVSASLHYSVFTSPSAALYVVDISSKKPILQLGYNGTNGGYSGTAYLNEILDVTPFIVDTSGDTGALLLWGIDPYTDTIYAIHRVKSTTTATLYKLNSDLSVVSSFDVSALYFSATYLPTYNSGSKIIVRGEDLYFNQIAGTTSTLRKWNVGTSVTEVDSAYLGVNVSSYFDQGVVEISRDVVLLSNNIPANVAGAGYFGGLFLFLTTGVNIANNISSSTQVTLPEVVGAEMARINILTTADYDTSGLTGDDVRGYLLSTLGGIGAGFKPLQQGFRFDAYEEDYQIKFRSRGTTSSRVTIPSSDLRAHEPGQETPPQAFHKFKGGNDIPGRLEVDYISLERDGEAGYAYADRINMDREAITKLTIPLVMNADEAYQTAEILLLDAERESKGTYELVTHSKYSYLEKTDLITVITDFATLILRVLEVSKGRPGIVKILGVSEVTSDYSSTLVGEAGDSPLLSVPIHPSTQVKLLDLPMLTSGADDPGLYWGLTSGDSANWNGGTLYTSYDDGQSWTPAETTLTGISHGIAVDKLTADDYTIWTWGQTLTAYMISGVPETKTEDQVRRGMNVAAYGRNGAWEIIKFQQVTSIGNDQYELDGLLRGQFGTDWAMNRHNEGDIIVMLDRSTIRRAIMSPQDFENSVSYLPLSLDRPFNTAQQVSAVSAGVAKIPHAVKHVKGYRDAAGELVIEWIPRARFGHEWSNLITTELTDKDVFEIDVLNGSTVVRTITSVAGTHNVTYTAAQQTTDFGSTQATVDVKIYQQGNLITLGTFEEVTI